MKKLFKTHWVYFTGYILFIIITALILSLFSKQEIHLFINSYYSSVTDVFFKYVTNLGDGLAIAIVGIILLFINGRMALQVIVSGITSGLIAQLLKKVVFGPVARPSAKRLDILFFILVILVSFSRVYLSQHFLADIFAGSIIGVITSILTYYFLFILWKDKFPRLDKPFIK